MDSERIDAKVAQPAGDPAPPNDDVEGHSIFSAIAVSGALRSRAPQDGDQARTKADENLAPLTKPFPSMRDGRRK